jgi:hypothetical protein
VLSTFAILDIMHTRLGKVKRAGRILTFCSRLLT